MVKGKVSILIMLLVLMLVIAGCSSGASEPTESANTGGELRIALNGQPPTLDQPANTSILVKDTSRLMFETLLTPNSKYESVPLLAEKVDTSEDSKTYTFHLRKGVKFHNGKEMIAEDVVASMNRWMEKSTVTGNVFDGATFEEEDDYTVVLELAQPSILALDTMASTKMAAAIMPKEVVDAAPPEGVTEYIGTGPYKFGEWKQDQYIHFTKFDDYQSAEGEADGLAGKKEALVDDIYFDIVTDSNTRLSGLQTGEYDIIYAVPYDDYGQLESDPKMEPYPDDYGELVLFYNENQGLASDFKIREAVNTALDIEEIMLAAFSNKDLIKVKPGYMSTAIDKWASDAGSEFYNQKDPEKAKSILKEIGYNNEEFVIMTTRDYNHFFDASVVIQNQLSEIGLNVKLEVYDSPTFLDKQNNGLDDWDAFVMGSATVSTPSQLLSTSTTYAGGVHDQTIRDLSRAIEVSDNLEDAKQLWDELQAYAWEKHLPVTVLAGYNSLYAASDKVEGFETFLGGIYWNTKVNK